MTERGMGEKRKMMMIGDRKWREGNQKKGYH